MYHERTIYTFKQIDPIKKFSSFDYYDSTFERINCGDCQKDMIFLIDDCFYIYGGEKNIVVSDSNVKSVIQFKKGKTILKTINA